MSLINSSLHLGQNTIITPRERIGTFWGGPLSLLFVIPKFHVKPNIPSFQNFLRGIQVTFSIAYHFRHQLSVFFRGVLKGTNPARYVDAPKVEKKKAACYDEKQVEALLIALENVGLGELKHKVATMVALMT